MQSSCIHRNNNILPAHHAKQARFLPGHCHGHHLGLSAGLLQPWWCCRSLLNQRGGDRSGIDWLECTSVLPVDSPDRAGLHALNRYTCSLPCQTAATDWLCCIRKLFCRSFWHSCSSLGTFPIHKDMYHSHAYVMQSYTAGV